MKMKLTIGANNKITKVRKIGIDGIHRVILEFDTSDNWHDLEFWLEDEKGNFCDHLGLNVSKRKKLQASK